MADDNEGQGAGSSSSGSIFLRKSGPLPNWVWMAILLLVAVVYSVWKKNRAGADENVDTDANADEDLNDAQTPPPVFILPQSPAPTVTINNGTPPAAPPVASKPPVKTPPPVPKPPAKPPAVAYTTVTVGKYTDKNPAWNSTLWGIAKHLGYGSAKDNYKAILNDPKNASLKKKIGGNPTKLPVGATVYVRKK
jgi:hypothetical protein